MNRGIITRRISRFVRAIYHRDDGGEKSGEIKSTIKRGGLLLLYEEKDNGDCRSCLIGRGEDFFPRNDETIKTIEHDVVGVDDEFLSSTERNEIMRIRSCLMNSIEIRRGCGLGRNYAHVMQIGGNVSKPRQARFFLIRTIYIFKFLAAAMTRIVSLLATERGGYTYCITKND